MSKLTSIAMLSVHTCPVAALGGKKTGGMNVYIRDLARQLGKRKIKVDIYTRCESKDAHETHRLGQNVRVIHIPAGPQKPTDPHKLFPHLDDFYRLTFSHVTKANKQYQLIHSHYWLSGVVGLKLSKKLNIPLIHTFHTLQLVKQLYSPSITPQPQRSKSETQIANHATSILGFTPDEKQHLIKYYQANSKTISLIPPGINLNRFKPIPKAQAKAKIGLNPKKRLLLFVGRPDPIKNLDTLLLALSKIPSKQLKNTCLAIIGNKHTQQLAKKLKISHLTTFLGSQDQRVLPYYYSASQMTIIPSSHESFGLVALESMACATPVIASNTGGLKHLVKHNQTGILVPPHKPQPLSQAIQKLLSDPKLHQKLSQNALKHAQNYSWSKITPKILKLYQSLPKS